MIISFKNRGLKIICILAILTVAMGMVQKGYMATETVLADWLANKAVETQASNKPIPIKYVLAEFVTPILDHEPNRMVNLKKAVASVNSVVIEPEKVFSFNQKVGPYTETDGWKRVKKTYIGNEVLSDGIADGVCQVATGVYNAGLLADFAIIQRHAQRYPRDYVEIGREAAIYHDGQDLVIKNRYNFPVTIEAEMIHDQMVVRLVSHDSRAKQWQNQYQVEIQVHKTGEIPFGKAYFYDAALTKDVKERLSTGVKGYRLVKTVRVLTSNGKVIKEELISRNSYQAVPEKIRVGTGRK